MILELLAWLQHLLTIPIPMWSYLLVVVLLFGETFWDLYQRAQITSEVKRAKQSLAELRIDLGLTLGEDSERIGVLH